MWCGVGQDSGKPCRDGGSSGSVDGVIKWLFPHGTKEAGCEEHVRSTCTVQDACICFLPVSGRDRAEELPDCPAFEVRGDSSGEERGCLGKRSLCSFSPVHLRCP